MYGEENFCVRQAPVTEVLEQPQTSVASNTKYLFLPIISRSAGVALLWVAQVLV